MSILNSVLVTMKNMRIFSRMCLLRSQCDDVTVGVVGICKNLGVYYVSDANIECYYLEYKILLNLEQY